MDTASKSNKVYTDDDDDEEIFLRRDVSAQKDLAARADGKGSGDQKQPTTPKSKHSATEQRRRSKINDRFQILRDLIPHSDQKRDKASFLLEVIEYIQFLHEKVQKYESGYSGWNQDTTKLMPWKNSQLPVDSLADPSHVIQNGLSAGGFVFAGDNTAPLISTNDHTTLDSENVNSGLLNKASTVSSPLQSYGSGSGNVPTQQRLFSGSENIASQSQWLGQCGVSGGNTLNEHELAIDEGTISISSAYSQGLLHAITQALHNSGIDLSQASISVQINLGKRALSRPVSNPKDNDGHQAGNEASHLQMGGSGEELEQSNKRHKLDKS